MNPTERHDEQSVNKDWPEKICCYLAKAMRVWWNMSVRRCRSSFSPAMLSELSMHKPLTAWQRIQVLLHLAAGFIVVSAEDAWNAIADRAWQGTPSALPAIFRASGFSRQVSKLSENKVGGGRRTRAIGQGYNMKCCLAQPTLLAGSKVLRLQSHCIP